MRKLTALLVLLFAFFTWAPAQTGQPVVRQVQANYSDEFARIDLTVTSGPNWPENLDTGVYFVAGHRIFGEKKRPPEFFKQVASRINGLCMIQLRPDKVIMLVFSDKQANPEELVERLQKVLSSGGKTAKVTFSR